MTAIVQTGTAPTPNPLTMQCLHDLPVGSSVVLHSQNNNRKVALTLTRVEDTRFNDGYALGVMMSVRITYHHTPQTPPAPGPVACDDTVCIGRKFQVMGVMDLTVQSIGYPVR